MRAKLQFHSGTTSIVAPIIPAVEWRLNAVDQALAGMSVRFALAFNGSVDADDLRRSLELCLMSFAPLFARHVSIDRKLSLDPYRGCSNAVVLISAWSREHMPQIGLTTGMPLSVGEGFLPTMTPDARKNYGLALKITHCLDGWVLGVACDHVLTDLHGLYGFLQAWASTFENGVAPNGCGLRAAPPPAPALRSAKTDARGGVAEVSRLRAAGAFGRYLMTDIGGVTPVAFTIDLNAFGPVASDGDGNALSTNDLINALLLKARAALLPIAERDRMLLLTFPMDSRRLLGESRDAMGNLIVNVVLHRSSSALMADDLKELAALVSDARKQTTSHDWWADEAWGQYWSSRTSRIGVYHRWLFGTDRVYTSNWSSSDIQSLRFGKSRFSAMYRTPYGFAGRWLPPFHATILPMASEQRSLVVRTSVRTRDLAGLRAWLGQTSGTGALHVLRARGG